LAYLPHPISRYGTGSLLEDRAIGPAIIVISDLEINEFPDLSPEGCCKSWLCLQVKEQWQERGIFERFYTQYRVFFKEMIEK
tara:strand:+ start:3475 stop:3720 length:246 start_codon:yes stop_codon:yes gene_type:complete